MKVFVTRRIPETGLALLKARGHEVHVSPKDGVLTREELLDALKGKPYDAVLCLLTDTIDGEVFDAVPTAKVFANYAVGFSNIDLQAARERGVTITNTPDVLTDSVAEHTIALILSIVRRVVEGDKMVRAGDYHGWGPFMLLGTDLKGKTLGILGAGRIGIRVAHMAKRGFGMNIVYYDVKRNEYFENEYGATFYSGVEELLPLADVVSIHVPLLDSTRHLVNRERLSLMKKTAYLVNTSRGPVVDESALVDALRRGVIKGAALDVFENEPALSPGLTELQNVVLTPHIASATEETREAMSRLAAENIIAIFSGKTPPNLLK